MCGKRAWGRRAWLGGRRNEGDATFPIDEGEATILIDKREATILIDKREATRPIDEREARCRCQALRPI